MRRSVLPLRSPLVTLASITLAQGATISNLPTARMHPLRGFSERSSIKRNRMVASAESRFITSNVGNYVTP